MFFNRRSYYSGYPYISAYTQAQLQQYRQHALATQAKLHAYREALLEAQNQNRQKDPVTLVGEIHRESRSHTPVPTSHEFIPVGHVTRPGSTVQSYSLWGSGNSSSTSDDSHRKRFGQSLCKVVTSCAVLLLVLGVLGVVGVAVYLGYMPQNQTEPDYSEAYTGRLYVEKGDSWIPQLALSSSPSFRAKSTKYNSMLRKVYSTSVLGQSFRDAEVIQFNPKNPGFEVSFKMSLDRRKLPWRLPSTEKVVKQILQEEVRSVSPVAFNTVKVDPNSIRIQREGSPYNHQQPSKTKMEGHVEVVPLNGPGSIIRRRPHVVGTVIEPETQKPSQGLRHNPKVQTPKSLPRPKVTRVMTTPSTTTSSKPSTTTTTKKTPTTTTTHKPTTTTTTTHKPTTTTTSSTTTESTTNAPTTKPSTTTQVTSSTTSSTTSPKVHISTDNPRSHFNLEDYRASPSFTKGIKTSPIHSSSFEKVPKLPIRRPVYSPAATRKPINGIVNEPWRPASLPPPMKGWTTARPFNYVVANQPVRVIPSYPSDGTPGHHTLTVIEAPANLINSSPNNQQSNLEKIIQAISNRISTTPNPLIYSKIPTTPSTTTTTTIRSTTTHASLFPAAPKPYPPYPLYQQNLKSSEIYDEHDRMDIMPDEENKKYVEVPSKSDIRSILEDLLFVRPASGNKNSFFDNLRELFSPKSEDKNDFTTEPKAETPLKPMIGSHFEVVQSPEKSFIEPYRPIKVFASNKTSQTAPPNISSTTVRSLPLDKFRIKAQTNKRLSATEKPNIWKLLSTDKPLILNMQVVTSKSTDVNYSVRKELNPVYVSTTPATPKTDHRRLNIKSNLIWPNVEIPVISDNEVRYIKINRTRANYPKVVIVNLPKHNYSEDNHSEARAHHSTNFSEVLKLFKYLKDYQQIKIDSNKNNTAMNFNGTLDENELPVNSTIWATLSKLGQLYKKQPQIIHKLYQFAFSKDKILSTHVAHSHNNEIKDENSEQRNMTSLPITTLFLKEKDGTREARVLKFDAENTSEHHATTNSPIHTFTFKEDQTIEELITEIFDTLVNDEEQNSNIHKTPSHKAVGQMKHDDIPLGKDYLMIVEAISEVLSGSYNKYNMVFDAQEGESSKEHFDSSKDTEIILKPPTRHNSIAGGTKGSQKPKYHKYKHELFPVMTRPMNPIRKTTPISITEYVSTTSPPSVSNDIHPVLDVDVTLSVKPSVNFSSLFDSFVRQTDCKENQFKCSDGKCIPKSKYCDKVKHCPDGSDESSCSCADILRSEHYFRKICDGIIDCWDKTDEINCEWCSPGSFICSGDKKCIPQEKVCDAFPDCPSGDDERDCVKIAPNSTEANSLRYYDEGYLMVRRNGEWGKFCMDNFKETVSKADISWDVTDLGEAVCSTLTFKSFEEINTEEDSSLTTSIPYYEMKITTDDGVAPRGRSSVIPRVKRSNNGPLMQLTNHMQSRSKRSSPFDLTLQFQKSKCESGDVLKVHCRGLQCGVRPRAVNQQARIVGGSNSSPGAWPWHAALYKDGEYQCGATLINEQWLISAGHCFFSSKGDYWVVRVGALRRGTNFPSPFEQVRTISHVFIHPDYVNQGYINDISVIRVDKPIQFNDYIRPVCLPTPGAEVNDGRRCTLVGWGQLFEVKKVFPDTLQEVEVPLISTNECRKRTVFLPLYRITEDMFCAGYDRGGRDACLGDSGGPLMCQKDDGRWEVVGVTSNGYGCARPHRPGVYTKLANYLSWIEQVMELGDNDSVKPIPSVCGGIRCPLGQCLQKSSICNGIMECSDGSDEVDC